MPTVEELARTRQGRQVEPQRSASSGQARIGGEQALREPNDQGIAGQWLQS